MAGGIRIPFVADVGDWLRGTRRVRDDLRDLEPVFDDVADAADDSTDRAARSFRDLARDADRELDRIGRSARQAGDDLDGNLRAGMKGRAGTVGAEVADEFTENFGEAIRSGNPADAILETFTSLGPALGALGLGAALVAGIVNGIIQAREQARQAVVDAFTGLFDDVVSNAEMSGREAREALTRGFVEAEDVITRVAEILGTDVVTAWERVDAISSQTGLDETTIAEAILGQADALADVQAARDAIAAKLAVENERNRYGRTMTVEQRKALEELNRELGTTITAGSEAARQAERGQTAYTASRQAVAGLSAEVDTLSRKTITIPIGVDAAAFRASVYAATAGLPSYITAAPGVKP